MEQQLFLYARVRSPQEASIDKTEFTPLTITSDCSMSATVAEVPRRGPSTLSTGQGILTL